MSYINEQNQVRLLIKQKYSENLIRLMELNREANMDNLLKNY